MAGQHGAFRRSRVRWQDPRLWLVVLVVAFFAISLYSGITAYTNFQTQNSTDTGIVTQAVASATFGHNPPFYESYDCLVKDRCSFLLVHPSLVLYGAVPFYALFPSTLTLFALRSALVAISAIPLYFLTRRLTGSVGKSLLVAGLFLAWGPGYLGDAFSLHLETILPLELFTLVALWQAGRYRWGLLVAGISFLTFEIAPVFTFFVGLFFLAPYAVRGWRAWWSPKTRSVPPRSAIRALLERCRDGIRAGWRVEEVRLALILMAGSIAAYVAVLSFMNVWGAPLLGVASPTVPPGISGVFYDNSTPPTASFHAILASPQTVLTAEFWLILYASLAFLPLLSPRALILSVPWIGWTFLSDSSRFTTLGHQYTMIAAGPLFIGLAYGMVRLPWPGTVAASDGAGIASRSTPNPPRATRVAAPSAWRRRKKLALGGLVGSVVVANLLLAPINPLLPDLGVVPGAPFEATYYDHSLAPSPAFANVESLIATIPPDAYVAASSPIFPLLANDPHAIILNGNLDTYSNLPFPSTRNPAFVLVSGDSLPETSAVVRLNLSNPLLYGMSGYAGASALGPILLYEFGYSGVAARFGPTLAPANLTFVPGAGLVAGPLGEQAPNGSAPTGQVIESVPGSVRIGMVAMTSPQLLAPGNYSVTMLVHTFRTNLSLGPRAPVLRVVASGIGPDLINQSYSEENFEPGSWTLLTWNFSTPDPLPVFEVRASLLTVRAALQVASVSVESI